MTAFFTVVFLMSWCWLVFYVQYFSRKLAVYPVPPFKPSEGPKPVSVVICAHNEGKLLENHLPLILDQEFPDFEVVLVNDASTDDTALVAERFASGDSRVKIVTVGHDEKHHGGKKQALKKGIAAARHELILLTDADCKPVSKNWVASMESHFSQEKSIVLGYSPAIRRKGLLNAVVRIDIQSVGIQYLRFACMGIPYMGTGRNLAYRKAIRNEAAIDEHLDLISGDDDLLINQVAKAENTTINISPEAMMYTLSPQSWRAYFKQKRRHLTTGFRYRKKHMLFLGLWNGSKLLFYVSLLILLFSEQISGMMIAGLAGTYFLIHWVIGVGISKKLGDKDLLLFTPILDVISVFFNSFVLITSFFSNNDQWK